VYMTCLGYPLCVFGSYHVARTRTETVVVVWVSSAVVGGINPSNVLLGGSKESGKIENREDLQPHGMYGSAPGDTARHMSPRR